MKKTILGFIFAGILCTNAFAYQETETYTVYETLTIDTVHYHPTAPKAPIKAIKKQKENCKATSSIELSKGKCGCDINEPKPIKVKTYTEVVDHYQLYKPVTKYVPAGTCKTVRIVK